MAGLNEQQEREIIEAFRVKAKMTREFYNALVEQGFSAFEALKLTSTYLSASSAPPAQIGGA